MSGNLKDWLKFGWLKEHKTSREEIADLLAVADRDLEAFATPGLHNDWRFKIAYGTDDATIKKFDTYRKKRNISDYERADTISDAEADDMGELAARLRKDVTKWIRDNNPNCGESL